MRTLAALEIDLAKQQYELRVLLERERKASHNILSTEINSVVRKVENLKVNVNQRKMRDAKNSN
jgi:hypothetical protein